MIMVVRYQREDSREPFTGWPDAVRDKIAQARISVRLHQVKAGHIDDCEPIGEGMIELRVHVGTGYAEY